jgi:hypothetical protein
LSAGIIIKGEKLWEYMRGAKGFAKI